MATFVKCPVHSLLIAKRVSKDTMSRKNVISTDELYK